MKEGSSLLAQRLRVHVPVQGHRFNPWPRKIAHPAEQLSLCSTAAEPALCRAVVRKERSQLHG